MKKCVQCSEFKTEELFYKRSASKDNLSRLCKSCIKDNRKSHYIKNKSKILKQKSKYYRDNSGVIKLKRKEYVKHNKSKVNKLSNEYEKRRKRIDPTYKLRRSLKNRCGQAFKRKSWRKLGTEKLLGCTFEEGNLHLESQFTIGMNWCNYGEWHIDHIIPLSSAKTEKELIKLCHYTNLQPLWALDNILKSDKILK